MDGLGDALFRRADLGFERLFNEPAGLYSSTGDLWDTENLSARGEHREQATFGRVHATPRFISGLADVGLIRLGLWSLIFGAYIWEKRNEINRRYGFDLNWDGLIWNNEMDFLKRFFDKPSRLRYA